MRWRGVFAIAAAGGVLSILVACAATRENSPQAYELREMSTAVTNLAVVSPDNLWVVSQPSFSDDRSLVYSARQWVEDRLPDSVSVWRSPAIGGAATKLISAGENERLLHARTSPSARYVYMTVGCSVFSTGKNGIGGRRKMAGSGFCDYGASPFPDESRVLFLSCNHNQDCYSMDSNYIWVVNADGTNMMQLRQGVHAAISPDGKLVAFSHGGDIWTMGLDGSEATNLTASAEYLDVQPSFSSDGKQILFTRHRKLSRSDALADADASMPSGGAASPTPARMASSQESVQDYLRRLAGWGNADIWMMNADGTSQVQLTMNPATDMWPSAGPDGYVYFVSERGPLLGGKNVRRIWRMQILDATGGRPEAPAARPPPAATRQVEPAGPRQPASQPPPAPPRPPQLRPAGESCSSDSECWPGFQCLSMKCTR